MNIEAKTTTIQTTTSEGTSTKNNASTIRSIDDILSTDALLHVVSFLPDGKDVFKLSCANKRLHRVLVESDEADEKIWKRLCETQENRCSAGGRNGRVREDIIVRAEDCTVRENIEQSAAASFTHARSKGRRWRKKENKKENEKEEEEKCFKWRDLYAWRRRILGSAERARENDTTRSMSTSSSSQESKHLKYRLAVCDNKSIFTCDPREGGGRIRMLHETTMNRFVFTSLTWSNNSELLSVLMQSVRGYSVLLAAPHESEFWRDKMKCDVSTMAKLSRDDDLDDDGDSGVNNAKDNKLRVIDEEEKENEKRKKRRRLVRDVLYALDDSDDERELDEDGEENEVRDAEMINSRKAADEEEEEAAVFPLPKKIFDIYESEVEDEDEEGDTDDDNEGRATKHKTTKQSSPLLQTALEIKIDGQKRGEKNNKTASKKRKTIYEKKKEKNIEIKPLPSPPPLVNSIVLPKTTVPFGIQFAPCGTKLAIVAREKAIVPQVQVQHEPSIAPAPISQHALEPLDNDGTNDDNTPAVAELAEVGELNAHVAAGAVIEAPDQVNVGVQTIGQQQQDHHQQQQHQQHHQQQVNLPHLQVPGVQNHLPEHGATHNHNQYNQQQQQGRDVSLSMLDLVQTMNSLYGFANNGLKFPRVSHPGGREVVQKIEQRDASMIFSFAPDNSGDLIGVSKKLNAVRLIENATNLPISRGEKEKTPFPEDALDDYHRNHHNKTSPPVPLSFQQHYINSNKKSILERQWRELDDDEVDANELKVMSEHARMLQSWEQREAEVISGFLKYPFWNRTKKFVHAVANHSLTPAISKLVSIVTESGQKLIQVCRHPPVGLRLKRKRGVRRMNDSNNEDYDDDDYSLRGLSSDQLDGGARGILEIDSRPADTSRMPSMNKKFSSLSSKELYEQEKMALKETTRVPRARSESMARFCKKKDVLWQIGRGNVPITHNAHWIPGKRDVYNQLMETPTRGHWLIPFTLPDSFPPITYMMLVPAPPSSISSLRSTANAKLEVGRKKCTIDESGRRGGVEGEEEEPLNVESYISDVIAKQHQNKPFDQISKHRELSANGDISKFEKLIVCEIQPSSVFVAPDVTVPFVLAARPGGEHVAWANERAVYLRRTDPVKGGPMGAAVKILDLNTCTFSSRDEYNTEFMTYETYGQGSGGVNQVNPIVEPILYYVVALKWSNSGNRLLICLCTVFSSANTYCVYQWLTWDPPGAFFYKDEDFPLVRICNSLLEDHGSALELDENGRIEDCATITIGSYFFPSRQFKDKVLLVDGGLKQIWSPNEDAIVFPVMLPIEKSSQPTNTMSTQTNAQQQQQQQQQQQHAFVDSIVIQEFPLVTKKAGVDKNNGNKKKSNTGRRSKQQQQQQQQEKEERLKTYQVDDEMAIPFRARFLSKKHKGKNFIRVCEGKFCAWSQ